MIQPKRKTRAPKRKTRAPKRKTRAPKRKTRAPKRKTRAPIPADIGGYEQKPSAPSSSTSFGDLRDELRRDLKEEISEKINVERIKIIEILGIFVALFTFISVEFQIFRSDFSLREAGGLSMIILGGMLLFINFVDFFINHDLKLFKIEKIPPKNLAMGHFFNLSEDFTVKTKTKLGGLGFWIRVIFLILCIVLILVGIWLFVSSEKIASGNLQDSSIENNDPATQVQEDTIPLPKENTK